MNETNEKIAQPMKKKTHQNHTLKSEPKSKWEETIQQTNKGNEETKTDEKEKEQLTNEEHILKLEPQSTDK